MHDVLEKTKLWWQSTDGWLSGVVVRGTREGKRVWGEGLPGTLTRRVVTQMDTGAKVHTSAHTRVKFVKEF